MVDAVGCIVTSIVRITEVVEILCGVVGVG
jgi:hypothetical protein